MRIAVLGGDGFVGWPTSLHLSSLGHEVHIVDNLSRRWIDTELGVQSLTPMDSIQERTRIWHAETGRRIHFHLIDLARDYDVLKGWLAEHRPDAIVHFAEQRAAPYSMKTDRHKVYTVDNNVNATHNLLAALVETGIDAHLVHLGTMGVYGYSSVGAPIPEGYLDVEIDTPSGKKAQQILYPTRPGSVYHMTKSLDQILFQFYAQNDGLRITDLHQGIVWGTHTDQTRRHEQLINRFDYDGDYGTVLNRFLMQAAVGYPLTVHGSGGQTRAFIHIQDTVRCVELALKNPPKRGERVKILNQMTESRRVRDLARMVAQPAGTLGQDEPPVSVERRQHPGGTRPQAGGRAAGEFVRAVPQRGQQQPQPRRRGLQQRRLEDRVLPEPDPVLAQAAPRVLVQFLDLLRHALARQDPHRLDQAEGDAAGQPGQRLVGLHRQQRLEAGGLFDRVGL